MLLLKASFENFGINFLIIIFFWGKKINLNGCQTKIEFQHKRDKQPNKQTNSFSDLVNREFYYTDNIISIFSLETLGKKLTISFLYHMYIMAKL